MTDQPSDDDLYAELAKHPPPPDGFIPQGPGFTEYSYIQDGERIHGVANGVRTYHPQEEHGDD